MRPVPWLAAEPHRLTRDGGDWQSRYGDDYGAFLIPSPKGGAKLRVIASSGTDDIPWEHVSVSLGTRCPTWDEMAFIKSVFWTDGEAVMQLHVPAADHRNLHPYCLHLWRPIGQEIPRPPADAVAVPGDLATNRRHLRGLMRGGA
jgi:hypothetical protein